MMLDWERIFAMFKPAKDNIQNMQELLKSTRKRWETQEENS